MLRHWFPVVKAVCINRGLSQARPGARRAESGGAVLWGKDIEPSPRARELKERCELPQRGPGRSPEDVDFAVLLQKSPLFIHKHTSPVILTANFSDFAFVLGMTVIFFCPGCA